MVRERIGLAAITQYYSEYRAPSENGQINFPSCATRQDIEANHANLLRVGGAPKLVAVILACRSAAKDTISNIQEVRREEGPKNGLRVGFAVEMLKAGTGFRVAKTLQN